MLTNQDEVLMSQEWMIDVLKDLKSFARQNGLLALAEQLDDTILVATSDLASGGARARAGAAHANETGALHRAHGTGEHA